MELTSNKVLRTKNTSFSTDPDTFALGKTLASLDGISLSELVHIALQKEIKVRLARQKQNQQLLPLLLNNEVAAS